jgi:endonuclease/exonuclease/phosphatase family metal-dependent hydrolase
VLPEDGGRFAADRRLRVVTYNVHACIGNDGEFLPQRICALLDELRADVIGIQELEDRTVGDEPVSEYLARTLGMHAYRGATLKREDAHYGNLLLSREPAATTRMHDISVPGREPRGIIEAGYNLYGQRVRVLVTHFGLKVAERREQARNLLRVIDADNPDVDVLLGDFNEWRPVSYTVKALKKRFGAVPRLGTWPAGRPLLPLDSICIAPDAVRRTVRVMSSTEARHASDHLPLVCDLELPG